MFCLLGNFGLGFFPHCGRKMICLYFLALSHSGSILVSMRVTTWMWLGCLVATWYWALLLFPLQRIRENSMYSFVHYLRGLTSEFVKKQLCMKKYLTAVVWLLLPDVHLISEVPNCLTAHDEETKLVNYLLRNPRIILHRGQIIYLGGERSLDNHLPL